MSATPISMSVGVVLRKTPGVTKWAKWNWKAVAVLPGAGPANWHELRREGEAVEYHAATLELELYRADTEAYLAGLTCDVPMLFVIMRDAGHDAEPGDIDFTLITASPYEAQDYADSGEELIERIPMPVSVIAWVGDFVAKHHHQEAFIKRKRGAKFTTRPEDGVGDPRIKQATDVYRAPGQKTEVVQ